MAGPAKWIERLRSATEAHCDGPVISAAIVQPLGREGARFLTGLGGLAGAWKRAKVNEGKTLPEPAIIAVTSDRIYAFEAKPAGIGYSVVREVGSWAKSDVDVHVDELKTVFAIAFTVRATGEVFTMESLKKPLLGYRGVAADLVSHLA